MLTPVKFALGLVLVAFLAAGPASLQAAEPDAGVQAPTAANNAVAPAQGKRSASKRKPHTSDASIKRQLIQDSIAEYPGNCPCPYNTARNGSSCGRRSAYSRPGGAAPLCYPRDITDEMIQEYRRLHPED